MFHLKHINLHYLVLIQYILRGYKINNFMMMLFDSYQMNHHHNYQMNFNYMLM